MQQYGRDWRRLDEAIPGKTLVQIKNYFQNYKAKLGLDRLPLPAGAVPPGRRRSREPDSSGGPRNPLSSVAWPLRCGMSSCPTRSPDCKIRLGVHVGASAATSMVHTFELPNSEGRLELSPARLPMQGVATRPDQILTFSTYDGSVPAPVL